MFKSTILGVLVAASFLSACQNETINEDKPSNDNKVAHEGKVSHEDEVVESGIALTLEDPVSEPHACILPFMLRNGTKAEVRVTLVDFTLSGSGEARTGNMFAPAAAAKSVSRARVIVEGQPCSAYDALRPDQIKCVSRGLDCADELVFQDHISITILYPNAANSEN